MMGRCAGGRGREGEKEERNEGIFCVCVCFGGIILKFRLYLAIYFILFCIAFFFFFSCFADVSGIMKFPSIFCPNLFQDFRISLQKIDHIVVIDWIASHSET